MVVYVTQALQYWNPVNPNSLTEVIKEIIHQYKQYQYQLIKKYSKTVEFEYDSLQQLDIYSDTEIYMHWNAQVNDQQ